MPHSFRSADQAAFGDSALRSIAGCAGMPLPAIARRLGDDGLIGVLAPAAVGGLASGRAEAIEVIQAAGRQLLPFPLIEAMLAAAALAPRLPELAAAIVRGERIATIAWKGGLSLTRTPAGGVVRGGIGHIPALRAADCLLAPCRAEDGVPAGLVVLDLDGIDLGRSADTGIDPEAMLAELAVADLAVAKGSILTDPGTLRDLPRDAALLRAADMLGTGRVAFEAARAHVQLRRQFGRPLSAFQSVRHRLARDHVRLLNTERAVAFAASGVDEGADGAELACFVASAVARDTIRHTAESAMHLHGAIGQTIELPLHRYLRRIHMARGIGAELTRRRLESHLFDVPEPWDGER